MITFTSNKNFEILMYRLDTVFKAMFVELVSFKEFAGSFTDFYFLTKGVFVLLFNFCSCHFLLFCLELCIFGFKLCDRFFKLCNFIFVLSVYLFDLLSILFCELCNFVLKLSVCFFQSRNSIFFLFLLLCILVRRVSSLRANSLFVPHY